MLVIVRYELSTFLCVVYVCVSLAVARVLFTRPLTNTAKVAH